MYEAYAAVERAYSQGLYDSALQQAQGLLATLDATPVASADEQLRPRLLLLIGHCRLYGLADPQQAAAAYREVLERCNEPVLIEIAQESLGLCTTGVPASAPSQVSTDAPISAPKASKPASQQASNQATPATPWLEQSTGNSNPTPAPPAATVAPKIRAEAAAARPEIKPEPEPQPVPEPEPEPEPEAKPTPKPELIIPELVGEPEPPARPSSGFSREEEEDLARGLLLVEL